MGSTSSAPEVRLTEDGHGFNVKLVGGSEHVLFFHIFHNIGNSTPNWLIFFRGVETTNQEICWKRLHRRHVDVRFLGATTTRRRSSSAEGAAQLWWSSAAGDLYGATLSRPASSTFQTHLRHGWWRSHGTRLDQRLMTRWYGMIWDKSNSVICQDLRSLHCPTLCRCGSFSCDIFWSLIFVDDAGPQPLI